MKKNITSPSNAAHRVLPITPCKEAASCLTDGILLPFYDNGLKICGAADTDSAIVYQVRAAIGRGIEELERTVSRLLAQDGRTGSSISLVSIIEALSQPQTLCALLEQLLLNEKALEEVQRNSYYHKNGFRKLVLLKNADFKLRLHLWEANNEKPQENIHDHRWNFASRLLAGSFQTTIWEEDAAGPETRRNCRYTPAQEANTYGVSEDGQVKLRRKATLTLRAGDLYYMPASTLHQVTDPGKGETVTLMLTAAPVLGHCKLYAEHSITEHDKYNVSFSTAEIRHELELLMQSHAQSAIAA